MGSSRRRHSTDRKAGSRPARTIRPVKPARRKPDPLTPDAALLLLTDAIALVEIIELAMRTQHGSRELHPVCTYLEYACKQLARAHGAIDRALEGIPAKVRQ